MVRDHPASGTSRIGEIIGGIAFIALAAVFAYGVWFLVNDAVGDWLEAHGPQSSASLQASWYYAFRQTGGFYWLLLLLPSVVLIVFSFFMLRAAIKHSNR